MTAALAYEWMRIRTIRSSYWITAVALVVGVGLSFLISMGVSMEMRDEGGPNPGEIEFLAPAIITQFAAVAGPYLVAYILVIMGVLAWGHEYRHGMIRATLTANSSRTAVWIAKFVVLGLWVIGVVLVILLLSTLVGWAWLHDDGVKFGGSVMLEQIGRTISYALMFVWIGASVAALIRNQTAALVAVFIWPLAIEPLMGLIIRVVPGMDALEDVSKGFPYNAGDRIMRNTDVGRALEALLGGAQLSTATGFLIFGGFTAALMAASFVLFRMRDA